MTKSKLCAVVMLLTIIGLIGPVSTRAQAPASAEPQKSDLTDQIIIKYRTVAPGATGAVRIPDAKVLSSAAGVPLSYVRTTNNNVSVLKLPGRMSMANVRAIAARLAAQSDVEYAEPDRILYPLLTPNDSLFSSQWDLLAPTAGNYGANVTAAWDATTGSPNIVVGVIDTGQLNHADLAGRFVQGYDFINDAQVANDGNGRDADPSDPGDWITSAENASGYFAGCPISNSSWHGTHVAGTIGASGNNALGIAGINWQSKIQALRVLGKCGGYMSDIADAIRWAAGLAVSGVPNNATPARVVNLSLGGSGACDTTSQNAISAAVAAGTVVVVAAGNSNADATNYTPANCNGVISVAATGKAGKRAYYSNYGASVKIAAPGGDANADGGSGTILSTLNTGATAPAADTYAYYQGTSMATPHVVGVVSLMLSVNPSLTPAQVLQMLQSTATPFPAGSTCTTSLCGAGILNAAAAVAAAQGLPPALPGAFNKSAPATGSTGQATSLTLSWGASSGAASYAYCIDTTNNGACDSAWTSTGTAISAAISGLANSTTYYWQARAANSAGTTLANSGTWWSFTTKAAQALPGAFNKTAPASGATGVSKKPTLQWGTSTGATSYEYCINTTGVSCTTWTSTKTSTSVRLNLSGGTTYYWQVRARNAGGTTDANTGAWWSFRTS